MKTTNEKLFDALQDSLYDLDTLCMGIRAVERGSVTIEELSVTRKIVIDRAEVRRDWIACLQAIA